MTKFEKKDLNEEQRKIQEEKEARRNPTYIYHYCLNENLPKEHPDFCFNCWIDECENGAVSQQNYKYCPECESKGFSKITMDTRKDGHKIHMDMVDLYNKYTKATKEIVRRRDSDNGFGKFINNCTEADLELVFDKFYPNVTMVKGIYKESE